MSRYSLLLSTGNAYHLTANEPHGRRRHIQQP